MFFVLSHADDCVYWYTYEALGKWFMYTLGKRSRVNFLVYAHWFMSISILHMKGHSISVYQDIYTTSVVAEYMYTATVKTITKFYRTTSPSDIIFTKDYASTSDEKVDKFTRELNINYRFCIGSLIYLLSTIVYFSFAVHKLAKFSSNPGKVYFEGLVYLLIYYSLLDRPLCPKGVCILGRWCSMHCAEAQQILDSVPIWLRLLRYPVFSLSTVLFLT